MSGTTAPRVAYPAAGATQTPAVEPAGEPQPSAAPHRALRAPAGVVAVVPSINPDRVERLARTWGADLARRGVRVVVVANAASLADAAAPVGVDLVSSRRNAGFAASVNLAARHAGGWRWLLVLNDDLEPDADAVSGMLDAVAAADVPDAAADDLLVFDPETPRPIPGTAGVFANLSLLGDLRERLQAVTGRAAGAPAPGESPGAPPSASPWTGDRLTPGTYRSFSAVAIGRGTWDRLGALEERLPFCYEDAEYTRRFTDSTGHGPASAPCDVGHAHSASTRSYIDRVLPVVAFSAYRYLAATAGTTRARLVVVAALVARVPLVPAASAPTRRHLVGVARALAAVLRDRRPELPAFEEL